MPKYVETRVCRECGWEFALPEASRCAVYCPACRQRHAAGLRTYSRTLGGGRECAVLRTEVRGHLWRPSRWPKPCRSPDDDATTQEGAK